MGSQKMWRFALFLIILAVAVFTNGQEPLTPDADNKCGGCPCNNPCAVPPPPPPPSPPPPPPPAPKTPKPGPNCPPPPKSTPSEPTYPTPPSPSQYIYFTGLPGSLYPIDQNFSGAARGFTVGLPFLIGSILLALW